MSGKVSQKAALYGAVSDLGFLALPVVRWVKWGHRCLHTPLTCREGLWWSHTRAHPGGPFATQAFTGVHVDTHTHTHTL
jgi:hypothetical protein